MSLLGVVLAVLVLVSVEVVSASSQCSLGNLNDSKYKVHVSWVKVDATTIEFNLRMYTTGWVGIGFAIDQHKMINSDYLVASFDSKTDKWFVSDRYNLDRQNMPIHEAQQDGVLIRGAQDGYWQEVVMQRKIETNDKNDISLLEANVLLWAMGKNGTRVTPGGNYRFDEHVSKGYCNNVQFVY